MKRRIWGLPVVLEWRSAEPEAPEPVTATVLHVVHHYLPAPAVGGIGAGPHVIEAILQPRAAITEGTGERE